MFFNFSTGSTLLNRSPPWFF